MTKGSIKRLVDGDNNTLYPLTVAEAVYTDPQTTLKTIIDQLRNDNHQDTALSYVIELDRWNIHNDDTEPRQTTKGINAAIEWAKAQGYNHVVLPKGLYTVQLDTNNVAIYMQSGIHLQLDEDCRIQLAPNSSPSYSIIQCKQIHNSKVSGGRIIGDKKTHQFEMYISFERGGVNADGSLNNDARFIRSKTIDRYAHPGLLSHFRLWKPNGVNASGYSFFQYKDTVSKDTFVNARSNGGFAPEHPGSRGWFAPIEEANKMIIAIDISASPISDEELSKLRAKMDNAYYTHESGLGVAILSSTHIEVAHMEISDCTGDGILTGIGVHYLDPAQYKQEEMGQYIYIHHCVIHHCRRQGISLCGSNDVVVYNNRIYHIGFADDGVTSDFRNGTAPMFGIDIESLVAENNIPYKSIYLNQDGLETNYRITIANNYIHHNAKGHLVNTDGTFITIDNNLFEGKNPGGIISYPNQWYVRYTNNTFIQCDLVVQGNNFVDGGVFDRSNMILRDVQGAVIQNCQIRNGLFHGSSIYGYYGTPLQVDPATGTFTFKNAHGMGNGARICFEQWFGELPSGINENELYYTINITPRSFQVSLTKDGDPVVLTSAGKPGFNVSRYNYGRCYISNITIEKDWRDKNIFDPNSGFRPVLAGAVINQLTLKNCDLSIVTPEQYVGRPNMLHNIIVIEGTASFVSSQLSNIRVVRIKNNLSGGDVNLGSAMPYSKVYAENCFFQGVQVNFGNAFISNAQYVRALIYKPDTQTISTIANSYMEDTRINLHWLTHERSMDIIRCLFNQVSLDISSVVRMIDNVILNADSP